MHIYERKANITHIYMVFPIGFSVLLCRKWHMYAYVLMMMVVVSIYNKSMHSKTYIICSRKSLLFILAFEVR